MRFTRPLLMLIWKNWILHKRFYIVTAFEILLPILVSSIMIVLTTQTRPYMHSRGIREHGNTTFNQWEPKRYFKEWHRFTHLRLLFSPNTTSNWNLMNNSFRGDNVDIIGLHSEHQVVEEAEKYINDYRQYIWGAVIFSDASETNIPPVLKYKLRPREYYSLGESYYDGDIQYRLYDHSYSTMRNTFAVQTSIDLGYIKLRQEQMTTTQSNFRLFVQRMPYPPYKSLFTTFGILLLMPMMICSGFYILAVIVVKRVVDEKNNRAKEMMKMMGMSTPAYWAGVFISNFLIMMIISIVILVLYVIPFESGLSVLQDTSFTLFFVTLALYCASSLLFCCVITTLFTKAALAITLVTILWTVTLAVPFTFIFSSSITYTAKVFGCLLPNMAFVMICNIMSINDNTGKNAQWSNIFEPAFGNPDSFCIGTALGMMILSCVLFTLLLLYLDSVWPWQPGVPKSPIFCFYPSFWFQSKKKIEEEEHVFETTRNSPYFEKEPLHSSPSIVISHLSKAFTVESVEKMAVDDLSLNMYPGQITALLGHNGAGKTTTMNILTGIFPPTKGTAIINGHDIITDTDSARSSLGLCPQHNVLYDSLTVEEHLRFFAGLKGKSWSAMNEEIPNLIDQLGLLDKRHTLAKELSGGMKRKLSLGNAIAGDSQILILDEPTTGLDPEARRVIWDVLERIRPGRTILLTTHYMEEADTLGDRIAIMASGTVQCCGSAMFLKRKFGTGYHLRIEKGINCRINEITNLIQQYVPEAEIINNVSLELMYSLSNSPQRFSALFQDLEKSYDQLGIASCGITITTMDDVFLKVGQMTEEQYKTNREDPTTGGANGRGNTFMHHSSKTTSTLFQQMKALFKKRVHYAKRHLLLLIFQVALPMVAVILYLYLSFTSLEKPVEKMNLDLDALFKEKKYGVYHCASNSSELNSLANIYKDKLEEESVEIKEIPSTEDPQKYLIDRGIEGINSYARDYLVGGSMENIGKDWNVTAWYNGIHYNLDPISINLMTTSLLRYTTNDRQGNIDVTIEKLTAGGNKFTYRRDTDMEKIFNAAFLPLGLTFLSSSFVLLPIHERVSKAKLLQRMCGVHVITYWLMHLAWDFLVHICSSLLLLIPFLVYHGQNGFVASDAVGAIFFCLLLYGLSSTTLSYLVSFIPKIPSTGFSVLTILNALTGIIITIIMSLLNLFLRDSPKVITAMWFMRIFPNFAVTWGINNIHRFSQKNIECITFFDGDPIAKCNSSEIDSSHCCTDQILRGKGFHPPSYLSWEHGAGKDCLFLFLTFTLWSGLIIMTETVLPKVCHHIIQYIQRKRGSAGVGQMMLHSTIELNEDSDVSNERQRTEDLFVRNAMNQEALLVNNLTKNFRSLCAVNNLTFSVHKEECFGLLGINGAGKTTTFQMLAGDLLPTNGDAYIDYFSIQNNLRKFQVLVGYCPQFDALIDRLTGRETLQLFGSLRGIPDDVVIHNVNQMISMCDLDANADKQTRTYSGGTKRKLSLAIALIGAPPIVLLDEPTAGVDPSSRRKVWKTLSTMKQMLGVSYILTSHSMDECESLCNRIAIMVNGEFRCLGAMQSLKTKFGQGYSIVIKLRQIDFQDISKIGEVKAYIQRCFPGASLKVEYQGNLHYHITDTTLKWSKMFSIMEEAKMAFQLEDYVLSGTTLEQIFLAFARAQKGLV